MIVIMGWVITMVAALVTSPFVWLGWNNGVARVFDVDPITWTNSYWLALFVSSISSMFKASLAVSLREEN